MEQERSYPNDVFKKIASGEIKVSIIDSVYVQAGTAPIELIEFIKNKQLAMGYSNEARKLIQQGNYYQGLSYMFSSLVIEDSFPTKQGVSSDLGNIAYCYLKLGLTDDALQIYSKALEIDAEEIKIIVDKYASIENDESLRPNETRELELNRSYAEFRHLQGLHLEGTSRCYIKLKELDKALLYAKMARDAYFEIGFTEIVNAADELIDWINSKLNS